MAAQDAELQLKVGLDLAFFRQQLLALGQASAGYQVPVDFKFDRSAIVQQFRVLQRYFSTKTFNVRVESTTLETLAIKAAKLKEAIASLDGTSATVQIKAEAATLSKKDVNAIRTNLVRQISAQPIRVPISVRIDLPEKPRKDPVEGRVYASQVREQLKTAIAGPKGSVGVSVSVNAEESSNNFNAFAQAIKTKLSTALNKALKEITVEVGVKPVAATQTTKTTPGPSQSTVPAKPAQAAPRAAQVVSGTFRQELEKLDVERLKAIYEAAAKEGLMAFDKAIINNKSKLVTALNKAAQESGQGLINGLAAEESSLAKAAGQYANVLIAGVKKTLKIQSPSRVFEEMGRNVGKGFELGAVASLDKAFDIIERRLQERLGKLRAAMSATGGQQTAFPYIATGVPVTERGKFAAAQRRASEIDEIQAGLSFIGRRRSARLVSEQQALGQTATRLLPAGTSTVPMASAQEIVAKQFYASMENARRVFDQYFSANSYLPRATQDLARAMQRTAATIKALPGAKGAAGALPSSEMLGQLRIQRAQATAYRIDLQNAMRQQMEGRMLPAAGQTSYMTPAERTKAEFAKTMERARQIDAENAARFRAAQERQQRRQRIIDIRAEMVTPRLPAFGQSSYVRPQVKLPPEAPRAPFNFQPAMPSDVAERLIRKSAAGDPMAQVGPVAERLRAAAINFAKNAPAVIKYLNLFDANRMRLGAFPSANETPAAYIKRITDAFRQGPFGAGTPGPKQFFQPMRGPQVPGMPLQLALPAAGQTTAATRPNYPYDRVTGIGGGAVPTGGGGDGGERGGALAVRPPISASRFGELRQMASQLRVAREHVRGLTADQVPLVGGLVNLAREFKTATGQLILYGTAYRALAFIQSLPRQILDATKQQQQYTNAMQSATEQSGTFAKEMLFVDNVQRAFGLNLQTTRNGFVKLFASMSPSGFDSGSIEKLFVGISSATAALQLTPDKAERVIYAFGQMASKGQVMSEELKGQLGDVLPGALSIFAKAAGKSVEVFSKELEDGVYKGQAFRDLMTKVTDELINRFGTGAQAAGKSLQGLMNTVQADFSRTLGFFAPLADAAAKAVLIPLGNALRQTSYAAQIAFGEMDRLALQIDDAKKVASDLKVGGADASQIRAAEQNVAALQARYNQLNLALKDPAVQEQANNLLRFTQELAKAGTFVLNLANTLGSMLSPILNLVGGNLTTVVAVLATVTLGFQAARLAATVLMGALVLFRGITTLMGLGAVAQQSLAVASAFRALGVAATGATVRTVGLRAALTALVASTVVGAVVGGIVAIAGAFATMRDNASQAAQSARDAGRAATEAAAAGNVAGATASLESIRSQNRADRQALATLEALYKRSTAEQRKGAAPMGISSLEAVRLGGSKITEDLVKGGQVSGGQRLIRGIDARQLEDYRRKFGSVAGELKVQQQEAVAAVQEAGRVSAQTGQAVPMPGPAVPAGESDADRKKREKAEKEAEAARKKQQAAQETLARQTQQYIVENAELENKLTEIEFQHATDLADEEYRHRKELQDLLHQGELSGLDEIQARARKLGQELERIDMERIEAVRKAREKIDEAAMKVANARRTAAAAAEAATAAALPSQLAGPSQRLAALIGGPESYGGNYGAFNRGGRGNNPRGSGIDPNLTSMTIAEILQRQQLPMGDPQRFHAVGKYQIIHDTLKELLRGVAYGPTGVTAASQFDQPTQDALFMALAKARHVPGKPEETVRGWRQEWTGLSKVDTAKLLEVARAFDAAFTQASAAAANLAPALTAPSAGQTAGAGATFGSTGRVSNAKGWVHGHFQTNTASLETLIADVIPVIKALLSQGIPLELSKGQKFRAGMTDAEIASLLRLGAKQHTHSGDGRSIDVFMPEGTKVPVPLANITGPRGNAGITGGLPGSGQSWVGHLAPGSQAGQGMVTGGGAPVLGQSSRVFAMQRTAQQGQADLEEAQARQRVVNSLEQVKMVNALEKAYVSMATTIRTEIDTLFPVKQQQLENRLLSLRLDLLRKNMPEEFVDYLIESSKASDAATLTIDEIGKAYNRLGVERQRYLDIQASGGKLTPIEEKSLSSLNKTMIKYIELAQGAASAEAESRMERLQGVVETMKHADAIKKLQEAYEMITSTISDVTGLYKTFFKEVATGTSALEAMQKVQQGLADKTLTMFIDFAMKPMEDFFKKEMLRIFNIPDEEAMRKAALAAAEQQLQELKTANTYLRSIAGQAPGASGVTVPSGTQPPVAPSAPPALPGSGVTQQPMAGMNAFSLQGQPGAPYLPPGTPNFNATGAGLTALSQANNEYSAALSGVTGSIGSAGKSVGTEGSKFAESLGKTVQGVGMAAVSIMSIAAGFSQIKEGGISGVLGGIGSILVGVGGAIGGFSGLFKAPAAAANGAVWKGGFTAFADGGVVRGPTLGLIGEGKYSEAIVPLPDGKSIPVKMGRSSSREMLASSQRQAAPTVLSMNFQTTKFGSTEYVDVDQLQAAMAETRRLAAKDGATRGASLALDRLQNSPSARRKVGIG